MDSKYHAIKNTKIQVSTNNFHFYVHIKTCFFLRKTTVALPPQCTYLQGRGSFISFIISTTYHYLHNVIVVGFTIVRSKELYLPDVAYVLYFGLDLVISSPSLHQLMSPSTDTTYQCPFQCEGQPRLLAAGVH